MTPSGVRPRVLFVGAFPGITRGGATGGMLYACSTLLASPLSRHVDWCLLNSASVTIPAPPLWYRAIGAFVRLLRYAWWLLWGRVDTVLIFTSGGWSIREKGLMALAAKGLGKRVVLCPRSGHLLADLDSSVVIRRFIGRVFARCDAVVCQGETWKRTWTAATQLPEARFVTIHNWIDATPYQGVRTLPDRNPATVLYLGWVEVYKGIHDLIGALQMGGEWPAYRLIVCGGGRELPAAQQRVRDFGLAGRVEFRGWVSADEKLRLFAETDVFVLPSHLEGMPNALLEAMAAGRACIASTVGGVPDLLDHGAVGRLVSPREPRALAAALRELLASPALRRRLGAAARDHILQHNEISRLYPRFYEVLTGRPLPEQGTICDAVVG